MAMARDWRGMEFTEKVNRAAGRAVVGIGTAVAVETKRVTHVQFGTLKRSVHAAPVGYDGDRDEIMAAIGDLLGLGVEGTGWTMGSFGPLIEVGSWLPYACVEWVGRGHPGVTQGLEAVRGLRADGIVRQAFREEGL